MQRNSFFKLGPTSSLPDPMQELIQLFTDIYVTSNLRQLVESATNASAKNSIIKLIKLTIDNSPEVYENILTGYNRLSDKSKNKLLYHNKILHGDINLSDPVLSKIVRASTSEDKLFPSRLIERIAYETLQCTNTFISNLVPKLNPQNTFVDLHTPILPKVAGL